MILNIVKYMFQRFYILLSSSEECWSSWTCVGLFSHFTGVDLWKAKGVFLPHAPVGSPLKFCFSVDLILLLFRVGSWLGPYSHKACPSNIISATCSLTHYLGGSSLVFSLDPWPHQGLFLPQSLWVCCPLPGRPLSPPFTGYQSQLHLLREDFTSFSI